MTAHGITQPVVAPEPYDHVFAPVEVAMLDWLGLPAGAAVLDAGCGPGVMAARFAAAVGSNGQVDALDQDARVLARAAQYIASQPHAERIQLHTGDLLSLPFAAGRFDLAWCSFVLHHIADPVAAARELRRVVRPSGQVVVCETGMPLRMLPFDLGLGPPGLQDRLRVVHNRWFAAHRYTEPVGTPYPWGWPQVLRDAGCVAVTVRTFWLELLPPFSPVQQDFLVGSLRTYLDSPARRALLEPDDQQTLAQLTDPTSPHYLLARPDLHVLAGLSLYVGSVAQKGADADADRTA